MQQHTPLETHIQMNKPTNQQTNKEINQPTNQYFHHEQLGSNQLIFQLSPIILSYQNKEIFQSQHKSGVMINIIVCST